MTNQNTAIQRTDEKQATAHLAKLIESRREAFALVAGKHFNPDRLVKLAHGALARQPLLAKCTPPSLLVALMRCAELDLEPDSALPQRRMWLVPRWNKKISGYECTYIIDYRAQIQKARETGLVPSVIATEVRAKDRFTLRYDAEGTSITKFEFEPGADGGIFSDRGEVVGYFAAARLEGGEVQIAAMSKKDAEAFRDKRAPTDRQGKLTGPWKGDFDAMAVKSCLRKLWNLLPAGKTEAARQLQEQAAREAVIDETGKTVVSTAPIELDLGVVPEDEGGDTASEVAGALGVGDPPAGEQPDAGAAPQGGEGEDVQWETAEEEKARKEREAKPPAAPAASAGGGGAKRQAKGDFE
jgi:recombination protein RecT